MTTTPQTEASRLADESAIKQATDAVKADAWGNTQLTNALMQAEAERDQLRAQVERLQATEPFGYFRAEPMGWTDCAATDEGAIALYERPAAPAVPQGWVKASDRVPLESDGEVFIRFTDGSIGTGWATYWHGASNGFAQWTFPDPDEDRTVLEWTKNPAAPSQEPAVPQGWKAVPVDPTPEMKAAGINIEVYSEVSDSIGALTWAEVDAIYRAMLAAAPAAPSEPVTLTDSYAGVIAWIGDKQCKLLVTEDAIKHEHTPGVVMRNTAHQCVQEVIIAALREKEQA